MNKKKCLDSEKEQGKPEFFHYDENFCGIIKKMGYNLAKGRELNFGKGRKINLQSFVPEGKTPDYYQKISRGLGCVTTFEASSSDKTEEKQYDYSSELSCWDLDVSTGGFSTRYPRT